MSDDIRQQRLAWEQAGPWTAERLQALKAWADMMEQRIADVEAIDRDYCRVNLELTNEAAALRDRIADLEAEVHDCPVCHRRCKECDCTEKRIADLEACLRKFAEYDDGRPHKYVSVSIHLDLCREAKRLLEKTR